MQFGDYFTFTKFGGITVCNSPDFQRVNGILGFGLPQFPPGEMPGMPSPQLPLPLLFALTDRRVKNDARNHMLRRRAFTFFSTDDQVESNFILLSYHSKYDRCLPSSLSLSFKRATSLSSLASLPLPSCPPTGAALSQCLLSLSITHSLSTSSTRSRLFLL